MGDMAQIGQNGAQMLNSAINSMSARREMEGRIQMQKDSLAARERMNSANNAANDPVSKGVRAFGAIAAALNAHSDEQIGLMGEMSKIDRTMSDRGYGTDEDNISKQRIQARLQNNDTAMKMMNSSVNSGKFKYSHVEPDGSTIQGEFNSTADLAVFQATMRGESGGQKSAQELTDSYYPQTMKQTANPVAPVEEAPPADFVPDKEEATSYASETDDMRKAVTELQLKRDSLARGSKKSEGGILDKATSLMDYKLTDKERATSVRRLDVELAKKKKQIDSRQGN